MTFKEIIVFSKGFEKDHPSYSAFWVTMLSLQKYPLWNIGEISGRIAKGQYLKLDFFSKSSLAFNKHLILKYFPAPCPFNAYF